MNYFTCFCKYNKFKSKYIRKEYELEHVYIGMEKGHFICDIRMLYRVFRI